MKRGAIEIAGVGKEFGTATVLNDVDLAIAGGSFVTLRLTSSMYHRFHAPADGRIVAIEPVRDPYLNNPITRASVTMAELSALRIAPVAMAAE